jgi:hypothetical protein
MGMASRAVLMELGSSKTVLTEPDSSKTDLMGRVSSRAVSTERRITSDRIPLARFLRLTRRQLNLRINRPFRFKAGWVSVLPRRGRASWFTTSRKTTATGNFSRCFSSVEPAAILAPRELAAAELVVRTGPVELTLAAEEVPIPLAVEVPIHWAAEDPIL